LCKKNNLDIATLGIIAPFHKVHGDIINNERQEITDKIAVMTSGNLLNLHAVKQIGGFLKISLSIGLIRNIVFA